MQKPSPQNETYWPYLYLLILLPCLIYTVFYKRRPFTDAAHCCIRGVGIYKLR